MDQRPPGIEYSLNERDLGMLRVFADFAARQLERQRERHRHQPAVERRIRDVLDRRRFHVVFQPLHDLDGQRIAGCEALTRFTSEPE